jgi:2-methylcitrate dehydratase
MAGALARFVNRASFDHLSADALQQLKIRVLDSVGCAIGALGSDMGAAIREHVEYFGGNEIATMIGGGRTAPDLAALHNSALVRYLDFNDSYLAPGETCHPSDNVGAVLAAAERAGADGRGFLTALAVAYQVQCRLSDEAPVRAGGFDHTTQGSYAVACGVAKALGLDLERTANAIAISGTAFNALRVTRTGTLSNWKGLAYPNTAFCGTHATFLAARGITGPPEVFEGVKGFMDSIAGGFEIDWSSEDLERVNRTIIKRFNAEIHSQSAIEAALELKDAHGFDADGIESIEIDTFDVAFHIIGGGEEGDKTIVHTKEQADHSLNYMVAAALLDGDVMPEEYRPERIESEDVQALLRKVRVREDAGLSGRFPDEMPVRVTITLEDGARHEREKTDYHGFHTRPMDWAAVSRKFERLVGGKVDARMRGEIMQVVEGLEDAVIADLIDPLSRISTR